MCLLFYEIRWHRQIGIYFSRSYDHLKCSETRWFYLQIWGWLTVYRKPVNISGFTVLGQESGEFCPKCVMYLPYMYVWCICRMCDVSAICVMYLPYVWCICRMCDVSAVWTIGIRTTQMWGCYKHRSALQRISPRAVRKVSYG